MYDFGQADAAMADNQISSGKRHPEITFGRIVNVTAKSDAKKLNIVNRRRIDPEAQANQFLTKVSEKLDQVIDFVFKTESGPIGRLPYPKEEIYQDIENVCKQKRGPQLYKRLKHRLETHASQVVKQRLVRSIDASYEAYAALTRVLKAWLAWNAQCVRSS